LTLATFGLGRGESVEGGFFRVLRVSEGIWKENRVLGGVMILFLFFLGGFVFLLEWVG